MKRTSALYAAVAIGLLAFRPDPAKALNLHTWVSGTGSDVSGCGEIASPCKTVAHAVGQTQAGGEVSCKDAIWSGGAFINKSLTVSCEVTNNANNSTLGNQAVSVQTAVGDVVTLRGINLDGAGFTMGAGLTFFGSGTLVLDNVKVTGWLGSGVEFTPNGPSR